ncbi:ABC transporter substrate-binding protein [Halostella sp. JP-L12]|uniref:ABC transporter substrate-binding protein n=1 Tax=Halostella TaxID=1843185 RepID=UPI0013CE7701|nr:MULTISPECIES: ABC transporter substrate-binding protein [Halostella]NHN48590.1 ABC transporter substrate-binding protein [Halostella sp. JP-L12]
MKTLPADADSASVQLARQYAERLQDVGINANIELKAESELLQDVLINHEFDIFVTRHPGVDAPEELYPLLHSVFVEEQGWQNPFGITNVTLDDRLQQQRTSEGKTREMAIASVLRGAVSVQPFSVVAYPEYLTAVDLEFDSEWNTTPLQTTLDYLRLRPEDPMAEDREELGVAIMDGNITSNRNPIAVEYHDRGELVGLLYDQLAERIDGEVVPWLAEDWRWLDEESEADDTPTAVVTLREDLQWHDGESITAEDVAFTFEFLSDTSMGNANGTVPAPKFRSQSSLVAETSALSERECRLDFEQCSREAATHAFTVPLLPKHIWSEQTELMQEYLTRAMVWENRQPVGSGPFAFESATQGESVTFQRFDDHFLRSEANFDDPVAEFAGAPRYESLTLTVTPSGAAAIELVEEGDMQIVGSTLESGDAPRANRSDSVRLLVGDPREFYIVGFNTRRSPLTNPRFRQALGRLFDRDDIAQEMFDGYAFPGDTPLRGSGYVPDDLEWDGTSAVGAFPGEDGELEVEAAKQMFKDAGYRYSSEGELLIRGQS